MKSAQFMGESRVDPWASIGFKIISEVVIDADGKVVYESQQPLYNALTNDGQASMLNVRFRGTAAPAQDWMCLLNMPSNSSAGNNPSKTSLMSNVSESAVVGATGYGRATVAPADWGAPALSSGDQQIAAAQKTFGPFTGNISVSHVGLCAQASALSGSIFMWVANSYYTNNNGAAQVFASGQSYLVTLSDKQS